MKKNTKRAYAVLGIAFILFNVIAFAVPTNKITSFWIAYSFTVIAFALQLLVWQFSFKSIDTLKSKFLGISLIHIGIVYLVIQLIAFAVFMIFPEIAPRVCIIICALILGISAICLISADATRNEINRVDEKVNQKVFYIQELQADVEMLADLELNPEIKTELTKLAEKIRYSDPMSNGALQNVEDRISDKYNELESKIKANNVESALEICKEIDVLFVERNKKCKLLK